MQIHRLRSKLGKEWTAISLLPLLLTITCSYIQEKDSWNFVVERSLPMVRCEREPSLFRLNWSVLLISPSPELATNLRHLPLHPVTRSMNCSILLFNFVINNKFISVLKNYILLLNENCENMQIHCICYIIFFYISL